MEIRVVQGDITQTGADVVIVNLFEGVTEPAGATGAMDAALDGAISTVIREGEISGKFGETATLHTLGKVPAKRVVVVGLGKPGDFNVDRVRDLSAQVLRGVRKPGTGHVATILHGTGIGNLPVGPAAQALAARHLPLHPPQGHRHQGR
jgi:leucyl aminopeptidase